MSETETGPKPPNEVEPAAGDTSRILECSVATLGDVVERVSVDIGPALLDRFSEHLYTSPNKAFEELVSNSWDAEATVVFVGFPPDLTALATVTEDTESAPLKISSGSPSVWVLDNGLSMGLDELKHLWTVAYSTKRNEEKAGHRKPIGKFGVGKLATYLLANNIVYFCKASDGVIRSVEVDYKQLSANEAGSLMRRRPIDLEVHAMSPEQLRETLLKFEDGPTILGLIDAGVQAPTLAHEADEFGGESTPNPSSTGTWTLVLLSSLKAAGTEMKAGVIRRMLEASLPLSASMSIVLNDEALKSTKLKVPPEKVWTIGPDLTFGDVTVTQPAESTLTLEKNAEPYPHVTLEGIGGPISGEIKLFTERISGGKSEDMGLSHGFFVNVRGRIINIGDNYFGLKNLSHSAWSKFRATVRADWLDESLAVTREGLTDSPEVRGFRAFLLATFNMARTHHDAALRAAWPKAGDILVKKYGSLPFEHLRRSVSEGLQSVGAPPPFVFISDAADRKQVTDDWERNTKAAEGGIVADVLLEKGELGGPLVRYDVSRQTVVVNETHPFSREHGQTKEEKELLRDVAFADLMTYAFMRDIGINEELVSQVFQHKDEVLRLLAKVNRRTAPQLAELLIEATDHEKGLEQVLAETFEHLGFLVEPIGGAGEPEGVATAPLTPEYDPEKNVTNLRSYRFTYDAKSTKHKAAKTGNVNTAGLNRHKKKYNAQYSLVVAVSFQDGALKQECETLGITPIRAKDLAELLVNAAATGPLDYIKFAGLFANTDPDVVADWVKKFISDLAASPVFGLDLFLNTVASLDDWHGPDALSIDVLAKEGRKLSGMQGKPTREDVFRLLRGLETLTPSLIRLIGTSHVVLSANPQTLRHAIMQQVKDMPNQFIAEGTTAP